MSETIHWKNKRLGIRETDTDQDLHEALEYEAKARLERIATACLPLAHRMFSSFVFPAAVNQGVARHAAMAEYAKSMATALIAELDKE